MTQGGRSQKSSILYLDFSSFALSCLISEGNTEIAESPVMIRLSAIFMQITVKTDISAKSKNAAERRSQITTQRNGCDLGRRSSKINAL